MNHRKQDDKYFKALNNTHHPDLKEFSQSQGEGEHTGERYPGSSSLGKNEQQPSGDKNPLRDPSLDGATSHDGGHNFNDGTNHHECQKCGLCVECDCKCGTGVK